MPLFSFLFFLFWFFLLNDWYTSKLPELWFLFCFLGSSRLGTKGTKYFRKYNCFSWWDICDQRVFKPSQNAVSFPMCEMVKKCPQEKCKIKSEVFRDNCNPVWSTRSGIKQLYLTAEAELISVHLNTHWQLNWLSQATGKEAEIGFLSWIFWVFSSINKSRGLKALP